MCWVGWEECICGKGNSLSNRIRTSYTSLQLLELEEKEFINKRYLSRLKKIQITTMSELTKKQVKTWFQNRHVNWKKGWKVPILAHNMTCTSNVRVKYEAANINNGIDYRTTDETKWNTETREMNSMTKMQGILYMDFSTKK